MKTKIPKCYICDDENVVKVFSKNKDFKIKHYYCSKCAKKYLNPMYKNGYIKNKINEVEE